MKIDPDSHVCNFHVDQNQFFVLQHPVFHAYNLTENALLKRFLSLASELDDIASKPAEKHSRTCQHWDKFLGGFQDENLQFGARARVCIK